MVGLKPAFKRRISGATPRTFHLPRASGPLAGSTSRAFSLVEFLVVVGIIAVLIGILLPALASVRGQADTVKCAVNLRQMAVAWTTYTQSSNGAVCPGRVAALPSGAMYNLGNGPMERPRWQDLLGATMGTHPIPVTDPTGQVEQIVSDAFLCPAVSDWSNARNYAYGYNFQFLGNPRLRPDGRAIKYPVRLSTIKGSSTIMAADSMGTAAGKPMTARTQYREDGSHDLFAVGNHGYTLDPPRLTATSDYAEDNNRNPADRAGPDPRHNKKANFVFCDSHVELLTPQEAGYVVRADESMGVAEPGAHNRMFSGSGRDDDPPPVN